MALAAFGSTSAFASRHPVPPVDEYPVYDAAAAPAYPFDHGVKATKMVRRHHRTAKSTHFRHRQEAHAAPHTGSVMAATPARAETPVQDAEATEAMRAGALIGLPEGFADGITTAIPQAVADLAYLIARASPDSGTIARQTPVVAIGRLVPVFLHRLVATFREAVSHGIDACVQSAYRPPGFGVGGFRDKFESAHAYGLAVDVCGIGGPGSGDAITFAKIAARHGVYDPYGPFNRAEWNHFQPTKIKVVVDAAPLRRTISADAPKSLDLMWKVAYSIIAREGLAPIIPERRHREARRHLRRYAGA